MSNLTLDDLITASGKYPERANSEELTEEVKKNGAILISKVNALLHDLGVESASSSSGFRPSEVNSTTANAAKKSLHMICMAIDLEDDKDQTLAFLIASNPQLLKKHGLWLEHPTSTKGKNTNWAHLDMSPTRSDRPVRIFHP